MTVTDTIAAIATPSGNGGIGVIRISGPAVAAIASCLSKKPLIPRQAQFTAFLDAERQSIDSGIMIYFPEPASFTGEDCLELQAHGGHIVLNMLLKRALEAGARLARPGEFSERAFLNGKIDLAQAEAIADLISSRTEQAARCAQHSLQGKFSQQIHTLVDELTQLRIYVEAAIDFVDEEIDLLGENAVTERIGRLRMQLSQLLANARQGRLLRDGMTVALAGKPNVGKSSLLNALSEYEAAIVTDVPGTTRDIVKERIDLDGLPLHIIDTAGLRHTNDAIEQEGVRRAHATFAQADIILLLVDCREPEIEPIFGDLPAGIETTLVYNKIDLANLPAKRLEAAPQTQIYLSVKTGEGLNLLREHLKKSAGYNREEDAFIARERHVEALAKAATSIEEAYSQTYCRNADLIAEELRQAQLFLSSITGEFTSDDLLGEIFSSFCIGK